MKTNKFWSIMLVMLLGAIVTLSSCGKDDEIEEMGEDIIVAPTNAITIDGKSYTIDFGEIQISTNSEGQNTYSLRIGSEKDDVKFRIKDISGLGESVKCREIEFQNGIENYGGYGGETNKVMVHFTKNGDNYTFKFDNVQFASKGDAKHTVSLNYTGPLTENK